MPAKSERSTGAAVVAPVRKPGRRTMKVAAQPPVATSEMLRQIKIRGDQLSSQIRELLVRLS